MRCALPVRDRTILLLPFLLAAALTGFGQQTGPIYFESDPIGLPLRPAGGLSKDEDSYVLELRREGAEEVRTLYRSEREVRRWETGSGLERVFEEGRLSEERRFDAAGRLTTEKRYFNGELESRSEYHYGAAGLFYSETFDGQGNLQFRDSYSLSPRGELRRVRRDGPAGTVHGLALTEVKGLLYEERHFGAGRKLINRFDAYGRLVSQEVWQEQKLMERGELRYKGQELRAESAVRTDFGSGTRTGTLFDEQGRELKRVVTRGGQTVEEWSFTWDEQGNKKLAVRRSEQGAEQWSYEFDGEGRLRREEHRLHGSLEKVTLYGEEDSRTEELYRENAPFLRIYFRSGTKLKEEFLVNGQVIRTREYATGQ